MRNSFLHLTFRAATANQTPKYERQNVVARKTSSEVDQPGVRQGPGWETARHLQVLLTLLLGQWHCRY